MLADAHSMQHAKNCVLLTEREGIACKKGFNEHGKMHKFHYETWMNALLHRWNSTHNKLDRRRLKGSFRFSKCMRKWMERKKNPSHILHKFSISLGASVQITVRIEERFCWPFDIYFINYNRALEICFIENGTVTTHTHTWRKAEKRRINKWRKNQYKHGSHPNTMLNRSIWPVLNWIQ